MGYEVKGRIIVQKGHCDAGHKVGEEFDFSGNRAPSLCGSFYHNIYPTIRALKFGADIDWLKDKNVALLACPDQENPVVIELRRGKKR